MNIAVRGGHNSQAIGAVALLNEYVEDRKVSAAVVRYLKQRGHNAKDVSPGAMDTNSDLVYGVNQAKSMGANMFVSIHFNKAYNSYNGALGTEVFVHSSNKNATDGKAASRVVNALAGAGFKNRGVKSNDGLYEMRKTKEYGIPTILIEVCFVEATKDVELYNKLGADHIGKLIAEAIVNQTTNSTPGTSNSNSSSTSNGGAFKIGNYGGKVVTTADLNVRSGRGTEHSVLGSLKKGSTVTVNYILADNHDGVGDSALWGSIDFNGKTGFIHLGYANPVSGGSSQPANSTSSSGKETLTKNYAENGKATVTASSLNIRSSYDASSSSNVVGSYSKGQSFYYDSVYITNKYVYCSYVGNSGHRRYVAVKNVATGKRYATCV